VNSGSCWRTIQPLQQPSSRAACSQTPRGENLCDEAEFTTTRPRELEKLLENDPAAPAAVLSGRPLRSLRNPRTSATRPSSQPPSHVNS